MRGHAICRYAAGLGCSLKNASQLFPRKKAAILKHERGLVFQMVVVFPFEVSSVQRDESSDWARAETGTFLQRAGAGVLDAFFADRSMLQQVIRRRRLGSKAGVSSVERIASFAVLRRPLFISGTCLSVSSWLPVCRWKFCFPALPTPVVIHISQFSLAAGSRVTMSSV